MLVCFGGELFFLGGLSFLVDFSNVGINGCFYGLDMLMMCGVIFFGNS